MFANCSTLTLTFWKSACFYIIWVYFIVFVVEPVEDFNIALSYVTKQIEYPRLNVDREKVIDILRESSDREMN